MLQQQQQQLIAHLQNAAAPGAPPALRIAALRGIGAACQSAAGPSLVAGKGWHFSIWHFLVILLVMSSKYD
jgi:hypothetical protein